MARPRTTVPVTEDDFTPVPAAPHDVPAKAASPHLDALLAKARADGAGALREIEAMVADVKKDLGLA